LVVTATGIEGGLIYALSAELRDAIASSGEVEIRLDLSPGRDLARLTSELARPRGSRSLTEHLRRTTGIEGVKLGLLYEIFSKGELADPATCASAIKSLPLRLCRSRPIDEAISSAGGVRFSAVDEGLMVRAAPGLFCAGEMLDWEAPTGGYLLAASFASGRIAGRSAADWLLR
jgi:predicted flavoprotein YhiN